MLPTNNQQQAPLQYMKQDQQPSRILRKNRLLACVWFIVLVIEISLCTYVNAFTVSTTSIIRTKNVVRRQQQQSSAELVQTQPRGKCKELRMAAEEVENTKEVDIENIESATANGDEDAATEETVVSDVASTEEDAATMASNETTSTNNKDDDSKSNSNDEINTIKMEINKLEMELKNKRRTLSYYNDMADDYTKSGYARKVAEMENMRRARSMLASSNKFTATAATLTEFVPALDQLEALRSIYENDTFGKQYNAVTGAMKTAFKTLGVTEYEINIGDIVDTTKMNIIESKCSTEIPKGSVVEVIRKIGLELNGNIVQPALCVSSLGPEPEAVVGTEEESANYMNDTPDEVD